MKRALQTTIAVMVVGCGAMLAQQSGTVNTLSVNPRQNQELTNSTGTETGQPSDAVAGSENEPNGRIPVTSDMAGSGSNGNQRQARSSEKAAGASSPASPPEHKPAAQTPDGSRATPQR